jgi:hypothetical protein
MESKEESSEVTGKSGTAKSHSKAVVPAKKEDGPGKDCFRGNVDAQKHGMG